MTMARNTAIAQPHPSAVGPEVRSITTTDLLDALAKGIDDFKAMPSHVVFLSLIYPVVGLLFARLAFGYELLPILFPLIAGFALIGPLAAIGLYELSRRRELGLSATWKDAFGVLRSQSIPAIVTLGSLLMAIFLTWLVTAQLIYSATFGGVTPVSLGGFVADILTTQQGWTLIVVGNAVGFLFALVAFTISVVSFPLLLDRDVGFAAAVATSARAVVANPFTMALWGLIVAAALAIGSLPLLIGLAVVMPVLGHSTWHLYRKVVEPGSAPRPGYREPPKGKRYAADFPAALFPWSREDRS
jgi:uncharacterized membrane protein